MRWLWFIGGLAYIACMQILRPDADYTLGMVMLYAAMLISYRGEGMKDYFDYDDRPYNDDTCDREEERPRSSMADAIEYDKKLFNKILNYQKLTEEDKYNLSSMYEWSAYHLLDTNETSKNFEDFLIEVNGREWFDNMMAAWLRRKSVEMAKNWNCPELANGKGIYFYRGNEE